MWKGSLRRNAKRKKVICSAFQNYWHPSWKRARNCVHYDLLLIVITFFFNINVFKMSKLSAYLMPHDQVRNPFCSLMVGDINILVPSFIKNFLSSFSFVHVDSLITSVQFGVTFGDWWDGCWFHWFHISWIICLLISSSCGKLYSQVWITCQRQTCFVLKYPAIYCNTIQDVTDHETSWTTSYKQHQ